MATTWTPKQPIPTAEAIAEAQTPRGGWTRWQLEEWGVPWPPPRYWRDTLIELGKAQARV